MTHLHHTPPIQAALAAAFALLIPFSAAFANDSLASIGGGGLTLLKTADIAILSERLHISPSKITVDYEMQNLSKEPIETLVAFPLPRLSAPDLVNIDIETDKDHPDNFVNFTVTADGKPVDAQKEIRAFAIEEKGEEVTALLTKAGIILPPVARDFYPTLEKLPKDIHKSLADRHLLSIDEFEDGTTYTPLWETQITYSWKQRFEPGKTVRMHHEYRPVSGRGLFGEFSFVDDGNTWCIDKGKDKEIRALLGKQAKTDASGHYLERMQVDYILTTGANWAGPIRSFELTVETERPEQVIAHCADGLKKVSPTTYKQVKTDYTPDKELSILFLGPLSRP